MKKLIFIDFDGTLLGYLGTNHKVSKQNKNAILAAVKAGYELVPCTGRHLDFVKEINNQVNNSFNYAIVNTSGIIYDLKNNRELACNSIPSDTVDSLCAIAEKNDLIILADCMEGSYSSHHSDSLHRETPAAPIRAFLKTKKVIALILVSSDFDLLKNLETEIMQTNSISITNRHKALKDSGYPRDGYAFYDIMAKGITKGFGVKFLLNYLGVSKADTIAIGDDYNDLSMFAECGCSVAMGNALPEVKEKASYITDTNDNDGVAKYLLALIKDTYNTI